MFKFKKVRHKSQTQFLKHSNVPLKNSCDLVPEARCLMLNYSFSEKNAQSTSSIPKSKLSKTNHWIIPQMLMHRYDEDAAS